MPSLSTSAAHFICSGDGTVPKIGVARRGPGTGQARSQDLKKRGGGFFERVGQLKATLTQIFIAFESDANGFSEIEPVPKTGRDLKKKKVFTETKTDFSTDFKHFFQRQFQRQFLQNFVTRSLWGGYFLRKNRPQKHEKRAICILFRPIGTRAPPPPCYATGTGSVPHAKSDHDCCVTFRKRLDENLS